MRPFEKLIGALVKGSPAHRRRTVSPQPTTIDFGDFLSPDPISNTFGFDRGTPIDRYYLEGFLEQHAGDVRGVCLEVAENTYTLRFGKERVTQSDTLHATGTEKEWTIIGDLTNLDSVADSTYDCIILTQVLQFIFDVPAAIHEVHRILKPGGVCLATGNGISQISRYDMERWGEYWRLTDLSAHRLFESVFDSSDIKVTTYGNAGSAVAFLEGLAAEELSSELLDIHHTDYQVLIAIRAQKASDTGN